MKIQFPIDDLKSKCWEFAEEDTQYLTHNLHRYSGKFIPQIASGVISALTSPGQLVIDPYCGSGTTLLESAILKRKAIGFDLNPLAVLISKVKTRPIEIGRLNFLKNHFSEILAALQNRNGGSLLSNDHIDYLFAQAKSNEKASDDWFVKWFGQESLHELIVLDIGISQIDDEDLRDVAKIAFSDILRRCSKAHSGYPNVMFDKNAKERPRPSKLYMPALEKVCTMVGELAESEINLDGVKVQRGNAQDLPLENASVDAVVTHPPYIASVPYAEYGALSLMWLGHNPKVIDKELTGGQRMSRHVVTRFEAGYKGMIEESFRVLKKGHFAFLMVGSPVVKGNLVDLEEMTIRLCQEAGFSLELNAKRKGTNRRANKMGEESLLFFKKP